MTYRSTLPKVFIGSGHSGHPEKVPLWRYHIVAMGLEDEVLVVSCEDLEKAIAKYPVLEQFREASRIHLCGGGAPICFVPSGEHP